MQTMSGFVCSLKPNSNGNKFSTGFTKLGQNDGLMLRRVTVSTIVTFLGNISESEIRKQLRFYVRYRFQDPVTQDVKEGGERWMGEEPNYFAIQKRANNKYRLTANNIKIPLQSTWKRIEKGCRDIKDHYLFLTKCVS